MMQDGADFSSTDETAARLRLALDLSGLAVWDMDVSTGSLSWDDRGTEILGLESSPAFLFADWLDRVHPSDRDSLRSMAETALEDPVAGERVVGFRYCRPDGTWCFLSKRSRILRDVNGRPTRVMGVFGDETDRREAERDAGKLLADLQHRIKNMVAIIRSMVTRTRNNSPDLDTFTAHFDGRLGAFARAHGVLARTPRGEASLDELLREELRQAGSPDTEGWSLEGPQVLLRQKTAEPLALAFHELVTNAVKYGSLTEPGGVLTVAWSIQETPVHRLVLEWTEIGALDIGPRGPDGFGMETLERALPYQLGAESQVRFDRRGLRWRASIPIEAAA